MNKERIFGLDIIRSMAVFFVVSVHFFGFIPFHGTPMIGENMALQLLLRQLFFLCIPLFILLTGYLQSNKLLNKNYYNGLKPILLIYLFYSVLSILFKVLYQNENISLSDSILSIFNYTANPRAWYINMYIGLFLLIPFLNIMYNNLKEKKEKIALILTLAFLTALAGFINSFPLIAGVANKIIPDWWLNIYPLTYYYIGAYIKEYQPSIKKIINVLALALVLIFQSSIYFIECRGGVLEYTFKVQYNGNFLSMIAAVLMFIFFYKIDIKNRFLRYLITNTSVLSLEIYLASFMTDYIIYPYFTSKYFITVQQFLKYYIIIVPLSFISSIAIAFLRRRLTLMLNHGINKMKKVQF